MSGVRAVVRRLYNSTVVWAWAFNGFRVASGLLLLPLLLEVLPTKDLGMYYLFLSLGALLPIVDFGFSISVGRYVSYAMGGARELRPMGLEPGQGSGEANRQLLWRLLGTTRQLFGVLSVAAMLVLGGVGSWAVGYRVEETSSPSYTWLAWGVALLSAVVEIYSGWWNVFLRGMNQVLLASRIIVLAYLVKLVLSCLLLLAGAGLLAVPAAGFVSSVLQRQFSRRACLGWLGHKPEGMGHEASLLGVLWPNSWRVGLQFLSGYVATNANGLICSSVFGLTALAEYGLSLQVAGIVQTMAIVWTVVKWPLVGQYRSLQNHAAMRQVLWPRVWLQTLTFVVLAGGAWGLGPELLRWHGSGKELLPGFWFGLLLVNSFLEMQFSFWTTLLSTENRIPSLWPTVATNVTSLVVVLCLIRFTDLGLGSLVLGPLLVASLFNYWYWPIAGARTLQTTWLRFTFSRWEPLRTTSAMDVTTKGTKSPKEEG